MLEVRRHSYHKKASILHIDRRQEFKKKLLEKESSKKEEDKKNILDF